MFTLHGVDADLSNRVRMEISVGARGDAGAAGGDQAGSIAAGGSTSIRFQFPPKVTTDSKAAQWEEVNIRNVEPFAMFMGAEPREFNVQWTYIVTDIGEGDWSISKIAPMVKTIRSYFYNVAATNLLIRFKAYDVIGSGNTNSELPTFRAHRVSMTHGEVIIRDGAAAYPLRTDVSMDMRLHTTGIILADDGGTTDMPTMFQDVTRFSAIRDQKEGGISIWF